MFKRGRWDFRFLCLLCTDQIETSTSPPTPGKARAFDYPPCPGSGKFDLCLHGVGKIEPEVSGFK